MFREDWAMLAHFLFMLRSNNVASSIIQNQAPMGAKYSKCHCYWIDLSRSNLLSLIRRMKINAFSKLCSSQTDREFIADFVFFFSTEAAHKFLVFSLFLHECLQSKELNMYERRKRRETPRAFLFLLSQMKSFVINKSDMYALYIAVCASKHKHRHAHART